MNHITVIKNAVGYSARFSYGADFGGQELVDTCGSISAALTKAMKFADTESIFVRLEMAPGREAACHTSSEGWDRERAERVSQHLISKLN